MCFSKYQPLDKMSAPELVETSNAKKHASKDQTFRLLDLPPELLLRICRFAVVKGIICIKHLENSSHFESCVAQPALSQTCKPLWEEMLKLFYAENEFRVIDNGQPNRQWAAKLASRHVYDLVGDGEDLHG